MSSGSKSDPQKMSLRAMFFWGLFGVPFYGWLAIVLPKFLSWAPGMMAAGSFFFLIIGGVGLFFKGLFALFTRPKKPRSAPVQRVQPVARATTVSPAPALPATPDAIKRQALEIARELGDNALAKALDRLDDSERLVVFSGHFSAGKSTLINALLGRDLLPTSDLRESGAPAFIRLGDADKVRVTRRNGQTVEIEAKADQIARFSSRIDENGNTRPVSELAQRLDIWLRKAPLEPGVAWVDTPGLNDDDTIGELALESAISADVLVWVLTSRAVLPMSESQAIARITSERGPSGVVFALNCFLERDDSEAFTLFRRRQINVHIERIESFFKDMGFAAPWRAQIAPICARAVLNEPNADWHGAGPFLETVQRLAAPAAASAKRAKQVRVVRACAKVIEMLTQLRNEAQRLVDQQAQKVREHGELLQRRNTFRQQAKQRLDRTTQTAADEISSIAGLGAQEISADTIATSSFYESEFDSAVSDILERHFEALVSGLNELAARNKFPQVNAASASALYSALSPPASEINVPSWEAKGGGLAGGAAAGAAAGAILGPVGMLGGALIGALAGGGMEAQKKREEAAAAAQISVRAAGRKASSSVRANATSAANATERIWLGPEPSTPAIPDTSALDRLKAAAHSLKQLADQAQSAISEFDTQ